MPEIPSVHNQIEYSVSEISGAIKRVVEDAFGHVRLRGEISGYRGPHSSGHCYFTLKDEKAAISAVMWRGSFQKLAFRPEEGLEIIAVGRVTTYPGTSKYQIVVEHMEPAGAGALMALLEKRKAALADEGLFAAARKQPLPFLPEVIGVVTSPTGAVIRDILHRISDRFPRHVIVWPVAVQGEAAAEQIAAAIRGFNALSPLFSTENNREGSSGPSSVPAQADLLAASNFLSTPRPDVLIVARGGGSIEDLWAFNEEIVVRAAAESQIPLISAVGHETDTTLIDYASDVRAPTPTAAAEMAVPVREEWRLTLMDDERRLWQGIRRSLHQSAEALASRARLLPRLSGVVDSATQRFDEWAERLYTALPKLVLLKQARLERFRLQPQALLANLRRHAADVGKASERLDNAYLRLLREQLQQVAAQGRMLESLNYERILERGFAVVRDAETGKIITAANAVESGQKVSVRFREGEGLFRKES